MFNVFRKKSLAPSVLPADKEWVEESFMQFIRLFGVDHLEEGPFILPTWENFPYDDLTDAQQFQELIDRICVVWEIDSADTEVRIFDDIQTQQWTTWAPAGAFSQPAGLFHIADDAEAKRFHIHIARSMLPEPQLVVSVLAHELAHAKLLGGGYLRHDLHTMEHITDLSCIFFGFGLFMANTCQMNNSQWVARYGYLPNEVISYANALLCYVLQAPAEDYLDMMNTNTRGLFEKDIHFLTSTGDTLLTPTRFQQLLRSYRLWKKVSDGFSTRNHAEVIAASEEILVDEPGNKAAMNNIGYAWLLQKNYTEAIVHFTRIIEMDPYHQYALNNRGYCWLQLKQPAKAWADLEASMHMDPMNSFSWRNLGAYYLAKGDANKALTHLEEALKLDRETELIHFYLGHAHYQLGNLDKAKECFATSRELDEHNDSVLEVPELN